MVLYLETWQYFETSQNGIDDKQSGTEGVAQFTIHTYQMFNFFLSFYLK